MTNTNYPDFFSQVKYSSTTLDNFKDIISMLDNNINPKLILAFDTPILPDMSNLVYLLYESFLSEIEGTKHILWDNYLKKYGSDAETSNIVLPIIESWKGIPTINCKILIGNHKDAKLVAKTNLKKMGNFQPIVPDSIISTSNLKSWARQREHLNLAFLPHSSLAKLLNRSNYLAKLATDKLMKKITSRNMSITENINDLFLQETQSQLQQVLLGMSERFNQMTNVEIRKSFNGFGKDDYVSYFGQQVLKNISDGNFTCPSKINSQYLHGPLSALLKSSCPETELENYSNAVLIAFAGHDTTGHTLTWLIYELCRHPEYQFRLKAEIYEFLKQKREQSINYPNDLNYLDFKQLPFLTRCITETLRLWPAVANGTFREISTNTQIVGKRGNLVKLPIGTNVQIVNWSRHRSKKLWGDDAELFNPDRDFKPDELWNNSNFAGYNPSSERFSPFSYTPRDCLGKNFAQMEIRLILIHFLSRFTFSLSDDQKKRSDANYLGINRATLGPENIREPRHLPNKILLDNPSMALWVNISLDNTKPNGFIKKISSKL